MSLTQLNYSIDISIKRLYGDKKLEESNDNISFKCKSFCIVRLTFSGSISVRVCLSVAANVLETFSGDK